MRKEETMKQKLRHIFVLALITLPFWSSVAFAGLRVRGG